MSVIVFIISFAIAFYAIIRIERWMKKEFGLEKLSWKHQCMAWFTVVGAAEILMWIIKMLVAFLLIVI